MTDTTHAQQVADVLNVLTQEDVLDLVTALGFPRPEGTKHAAVLAATDHLMGIRGNSGGPPRVPWEMIEWRIDSNPTNVNGNKGRARYISYITARTARQILDEWVGPGNWKPDYEEGTLTGQPVLWCRLSVRFSPDGEWLYRDDIGVPGADNTGGRNSANTVLKGLVSDAFKRAAQSWGIGREVYTLPEVWASCRVSTRDKGGKTYQNAYPHDDAPKEIADELQRQGYEVPHLKVESRTEADDEADEQNEEQAAAPAAAPAPVVEESEWNRWLKNQVWEAVKRDDAEAQALYSVVCAYFMIGANDVIDEAMALKAKAYLDKLIDGPPVDPS